MSFASALWRTLERAGARFVSLFGIWRHECRHGTLKRAPQRERRDLMALRVQGYVTFA
jgi:hypothetical protein